MNNKKSEATASVGTNKMVAAGSSKAPVKQRQDPKLAPGIVRADILNGVFITLNHDPNMEEPVLDCTDCNAECCKGGVTPLLTTEEVQSGLYPLMLNGVPENMKAAHPEFSGLITMFVLPGHGCLWLNEKTHRCENYDKRPLACRRWDCRTILDAPYPEIAKKIFGVCATDPEQIAARNKQLEDINNKMVVDKIMNDENKKELDRLAKLAGKVASTASTEKKND